MHYKFFSFKSYTENDPKNMVLRDHLAFDRTVLANERTLFAYLKFAIMATATGLTFIKLFPAESLYNWIAYACIGLAIITGVAGPIKFVIFRSKLGRVYKPHEE